MNDLDNDTVLSNYSDNKIVSMLSTQLSEKILQEKWQELIELNKEDLDENE